MDQYIYKTFKILTKWAVLVLCSFYKLMLCGHRGTVLDLAPPFQNLQVSGEKKKKKAIGQVSLLKTAGPLPKGLKFILSNRKEADSEGYLPPLSAVDWGAGGRSNTRP
ncbi:armadillo repeat-containing protein 5 [Platysternon megacephalum]|uniref:Armadillo repeat-containing protein 5 n=1 Tax=Platysternon megacephalum TaxID=55544 RepID=A0A4D9DRG5_9SAUR|nr:armadillo repeat-containing protein 5 [Platysternon megacephalum]